VEVRDHMSAMLPAYKVNEVAVSMWALARLKAQPGLRLMAAALQHCFSQVCVRRGGGVWLQRMGADRLWDGSAHAGMSWAGEDARRE
jgi:hypothetical protein